MPFFSFGYGHCAPNCFVECKSRDAMFEIFGMYWSMQYDDDSRLKDSYMKPISITDAEKCFFPWRAKRIMEEMRALILPPDIEDHNDYLSELKKLQEKSKNYNIELSLPDQIIEQLESL